MTILDDRPIRRVVGLLLTCTGLLAGTAVAEDPKCGAGDRMMVIGASASAGFVKEEMLGGIRTPEYRLKYYLDAALSEPHQEVQASTSAMFFMSVPVISNTQVKRAIAEKPSLTVAVDFLFWFCYGRLEDEKKRLDLLEKGLALLEEIPGPLVVGDIPDASSAIGSILAREEVPAPVTLAAANRRIREWAAGRPAVVLISLADFMATCKADRALEFGPAKWPRGSTRRMLQADQLHASHQGCAALALGIISALTERGLVPKESVLWDPEAIRVKAIANSEPESATIKERKGKKAPEPLSEAK